MTIWILGVVLIAGLAALGRQIGSIRMGVSIIGAIVAYVATIFLAPLVTPHLETVGVKNPITAWWLGPVAVFLAVYLFMNGIAQGIYMKVKVFFDYRAKEDAKIRFERMDTNLGLSLGIANGAVLLCILSVPIYIAGHVTVQLASDNDPFIYSTLSKARKDLTSTGMDKIAAAIAPKTDKLFVMADTAAIIYHNPSVQEFLKEYPEFYTLAESETFAAYFDGDFGTLVTGKGGLGNILVHEKALEVMADLDLMTKLTDLDYADLQEFIKTGVSQKYKDHELVGKWRIDIPRSVRDYGRKYPQVPGAYLSRLPEYIKDRYGDITLTIAPDSGAFLKGAAGNFPTFYQLVTLYQNRTPLPPLPARAVPQQLAIGNWSGSGEKITVTLAGKAGKSEGGGTLKNNVLSFTQSGNTCVFYRYL
jgi:hypothetical protein